MSHLGRLQITFFVRALVFGCITVAGSGCSGPYPSDYAWGFANATNEQLTEVYLLAPDNSLRYWGHAGDLPHQKTVSDSEGHYPMPQCGLLVWRDQNGHNHQQLIAIAPSVALSARDPRHFDNGVLWFIYLNGEWKLYPMTAGETRWQVLHCAGQPIGDPTAPLWINAFPTTFPAIPPPDPSHVPPPSPF